MQRPVRVTKVFLAAALLSALGGAVAPVLAQQVMPAVPSEAAATCLCLERELPGLRAEMELRRGILAEREGELERLGMDIEVKRASMTPGDEIAMSDLKTMIERQQALRGLIRRDISPSYRSSLENLNSATAAYNATCANKRIEQADIDRLQGNLQCPVRN